MKIATIGTGAMGSLFAGRLSPHCDLYMLGSWPEQILLLNQHPLKIINPDGSEVYQEVQAKSSLADIPPVDIALILVKCWQTARAASQASTILKPDGLAITLQNGLGNLEILEAEVGKNRATLGVTSEGATMIGAGVVRHAGFGVTHLASIRDTLHKLRPLARVFREAGFQTAFVDSGISLLWGKLAVNAGINPLTALLGVRNGFLADDEQARQVMGLAAEEAADVARSLGIKLPYSSAKERALTVALATANNLSSMAQDMMRGTPTELDAITGEIVRLGDEKGVPTPVNLALLQLMTEHIAGGEWRDEIGRLPESVRPMFARLAHLEIE